MDKFLDTVEMLWENNIVKSLVYLALALVAAGLVSFVVKRIFKLIRFDTKLDSLGINEGQDGTAAKFIGKLVFLIVFLLFLPAILGPLGLETVSKPLGDFANVFLEYIPKVIAAAILIFVGVFVGGLLSRLVTVLLAKTKIDSLTKKLSHRGDSDETDGSGTGGYMPEGVKISAVIGKVLNALIILITIVEALTVLDIDAISGPAVSIINTVFSAIPNIILASLVVAVGIIVSNVVCALISNLLTALNFDGMASKIAPNGTVSFSLTKTVTNIVRTVIILFVVAEGVKILGLEILSGVAAMIISYLPMIIKAALIALAAIFLANLLDGALRDSKMFGTAAAKILKTILFVVAGFMILDQLAFATTIVSWAFILTLSALAVAFALAFGLGGRDFAKKALDKVKLDKSDKDENKNS